MGDNKKTCDWCERKMLKQNLKKHVNVCQWRKKVKVKKSKLQKILRRENMEDDEEEEKNARIRQLSYLELTNYLRNIYNNSIYLYKKIIMSSERDPIERLQEMQVSDVTKENYIREWKLYLSWLDDNNLLVNKDTANTYLSSLTNRRASTIRAKHSLLDNIFKFLIDPTVMLNKFNRRISFTPKYVMKDEEIKSLSGRTKRNKCPGLSYTKITDKIWVEN